MEKLSAGDLIVVSIDGVKYPATLRSLDSATGTFHCEYTAWGQGGKRTVDPLPVSAIFSFSVAGLGDECVVGTSRRRSLLLHAATSVPETTPAVDLHQHHHTQAVLCGSNRKFTPPPHTPPSDRQKWSRCFQPRGRPAPHPTRWWT